MPTILDPTDEQVTLERRLAARPSTLDGTLGLLDISKLRGDVLLQRLERDIRARLPGLEIRRYSKPTYTKPAPESLRRKIAQECDFVIEALAD